jgi:DNA-directed RNA polymerase subunit E'/Rpb7
MSADLFMPIKFRSTIQLTPKELSSDFQNVILKKLKNNLENVCSRHGFIKNDSIKIIKRSMGQLKKQHFNGNVMFEIQCIAEICNPAQGSIIKCKVKAKNSLGILAEGYYGDVPILEIIIPKISAGIKSDINIDTISIGEEINIEVCGKKFQLYDKHISIIGKAIKDKEENIKIAVEEDLLEEDKNDETSTLLLDDEVLLLDDDDEPPEDEDDDENSTIAKKNKAVDDDEDDEEEEEDEEEDIEGIDEFEEDGLIDDAEFGGELEADFD